MDEDVLITPVMKSFETFCYKRKERNKWTVTGGISGITRMKPFEQMEKLKLVRVQTRRKLELALER